MNSIEGGGFSASDIPERVAKCRERSGGYIEQHRAGGKGPAIAGNPYPGRFDGWQISALRDLFITNLNAPFSDLLIRHLRMMTCLPFSS